MIFEGGTEDWAQNEYDKSMTLKDLQVFNSPLGSIHPDQLVVDPHA